MDTEQHLGIFQQAANHLDQTLLANKGLSVAALPYMESICLKLYKPSWANPNQDPITSPSRIFFSVWVAPSSLETNRLLYNIHALKLRHLQGYAIESRKFATHFRAAFAPYANEWPNVSVAFGPLTLMEGWATIDTANYQDTITELANQFLNIEHLVDDCLAHFKK